MRHHVDGVYLGVRRDARRFGDSTAARDIRLDEADLAVVDELLEPEPRRLVLSADDAHRSRFLKPLVAKIVVRPKRFLHGIGIVLLDGLHKLDAGGDVDRHLVGRNVTDVKDEVDVIADRLARGLDELDLRVDVLLEAAPAKLDRRVALLFPLHRLFLRLCLGVGHENGRVAAHLVAVLPAEKLPDRLVECLAENIPDGDVDTAHRLDRGTVVAVEVAVQVHVVPNLLVVERIAPDHDVREPLARAVRDRRLDDGLNHPRR